MSDNIDFLPSRYRDQSVRRKSRIWLVSILGIFASVIAITSTIQFALQKQVKTQLATIEFQYGAAEATQNMFNRLQKNLVQVRASANLYSYLESRWPRTQIVFAVSRPLTDEITLSELLVAIEDDENEQRSRSGSRRRRRGAPETKKKTGQPAKQDLDSLLEQVANKQTVVHLAGTTTDDVALHRYISELGSDALFEKAELLKSTKNRDVPSAEFLLRVIVRSEEEAAQHDERPALSEGSPTDSDGGLR